MPGGRPWSLSGPAEFANSINYYPHLLKKIVFAGTQHTSFAQGIAALAASAGRTIATKQVERVTEKIGHERIGQCDRAVADFRETTLMTRCRSPIPHPPDLAVVEMDGGRLQILDRRVAKPDPAGASDDAGEPEEKRGHWRKDKIGVLMTMTGTVSSADPRPEIPGHFIDPMRILKLARQIKGPVSVAEDGRPESTA